MRPHALLLACLTVSGCATTKPPLIVKPERIPPAQAMVPCVVQLCTLRDTFKDMSLDDQGALILACRIADAEAYRACEVKQRALVDWINSGR